MSGARMIGWAGLVALAIAGLVGVVVGPHALLELAPRCMFRELSGYECPTCGMTRALASLCQGDVRAMLHHNAASPLVLVSTVWGLVRLTLSGRRSGPAERSRITEMEHAAPAR